MWRAEGPKVGRVERENVGSIHGLAGMWTMTRFRSLWDLYHPKILEEMRANKADCGDALLNLRLHGRNITRWLLYQTQW